MPFSPQGIWIPPKKDPTGAVWKTATLCLCLGEEVPPTTDAMLARTVAATNLRIRIVPFGPDSAEIQHNEARLTVPKQFGAGKRGSVAYVFQVPVGPRTVDTFVIRPLGVDIAEGQTLVLDGTKVIVEDDEED